MLSLFFYVHEGLRGRYNPVFGERPGLLEPAQSPQLIGVCDCAAREVVHELRSRYPRAGMRLLPEPPGRILQHARHLDQGHHLLHGSRGIDQDAFHLALGDRPAELEPLRALQDSADIFRLDGKKDCRHGQVFTNLTFIPRMWAFPAHARAGLSRYRLARSPSVQPRYASPNPDGLPSLTRIRSF